MKPYILLFGMLMACGEVEVSTPATAPAPNGVAPQLTSLPAVLSPGQPMVTAQAPVANAAEHRPVQWTCTDDDQCWGRACRQGACGSAEHCSSDRNCVFGAVCEAGECRDVCARDHLDDEQRLRTPFHAVVPLPVGLYPGLTVCPNDEDQFRLAAEGTRLVQVRGDNAEQLELIVGGERIENCSPATCSSRTFTCLDSGDPCAGTGATRHGVLNQPGEQSVYMTTGERLRVLRRVGALGVLRYDLEVR